MSVQGNKRIDIQSKKISGKRQIGTVNDAKHLRLNSAASMVNLNELISPVLVVEKDLSRNAGLISPIHAERLHDEAVKQMKSSSVSAKIPICTDPAKVKSFYDKVVGNVFLPF